MLLLESDAKELLRRHGIAVPRGIAAATPAAAAAALADLSAPVVVKVLSPDIVHKTDVGGVRVGLDGPEEVEAAAAAILASVAAAASDAEVAGLLVEEMSPPGVEVIVGTVADDVFGTILSVGLGGIAAEVFEDLAFCMVPLEPHDVDEMLAQIRGAKLLSSFRGQTRDTEALKDMLLRIAGRDGLLEQVSTEISELELNPVLVTADGACAVDAVVRLR